MLCGHISYPAVKCFMVVIKLLSLYCIMYACFILLWTNINVLCIHSECTTQLSLHGLLFGRTFSKVLPLLLIRCASGWLYRIQNVTFSLTGYQSECTWHCHIFIRLYMYKYWYRYNVYEWHTKSFYQKPLTKELIWSLISSICDGSLILKKILHEIYIQLYNI